MKKFSSLVVAAGSLVGVALAACPPPLDIVYCSAIGATPGSNGWVATGNYAQWQCCNQNYYCGNSGNNYGYQFFKPAAEYQKGASKCCDVDNPSNAYPTPAICCRPSADE